MEIGSETWVVSHTRYTRVVLMLRNKVVSHQLTEALVVGYTPPRFNGVVEAIEDK
jgi:hypothetical protein